MSIIGISSSTSNFGKKKKSLIMNKLYFFFTYAFNFLDQISLLFASILYPLKPDPICSCY